MVGTRSNTWKRKKVGVSTCLIWLCCADFLIWWHSQNAIAESHIVNVLRRMVEKAWQWAKNSKNHRVNKIHGEEEIFIMVSETFNSIEKDEEHVDREGRMEVEACHETSESHTPSLHTLS